MNNNLNAQALPFRPGGQDDRRREQNYTGFENQLPAPPPFPPGPASAPWNANYPPPPPQFYNSINHNQQTNQQSYNDYAAQAQAQAQAQQAYYHQFMPQYPGGFQYGQQPYRPQQPYYGAFGQQNQRAYSNQAYHHSTMQAQAHHPYGATNEDLQTSTPPLRNTRSGAAFDGQVKQKDTPKLPKGPTASSKKGRYGDEKIMLPAPQPTPEYLSQAAEEPSVIDPPGRVLVILDLNGTVLYRPNRNAKTMIERPFLKPFLRYLFQNFSVMVWSSAKPDNVKSLVTQSLDKDLQSKLVARWARDSFGLSPTNYTQNVQVYKNLRLIWSRDVIQQHHPEYAAGKRFGQHNTVLIDDSAIKASAQPHNLLEIPEFAATPEQMEGDVLREVAGYLELLRHQADVSQFISKEPFKDDGRWSFQWPDEASGGGEMKSKASAKGKKQKAKAAGGAESKFSLKMYNEAKDADTNGANVDTSAERLSETIDSLSSVSLVASAQKDW
ncbi:HAD-like protein [Cucurbitaria berberidis CBS 394.84]|uniref:Mitochondrial import inner membrane translocase subunit TIM50 n=1 Tax=Cucurbitaria berberidis CBS 394.84 TaxID=1168544 RepID=A0A9P4GG18_9PLEO|nr:HAD-like protein [Cucurbitaria berberidis CBS 394.84]KAF1844510.1 HAD-like protein [Cucurbitaria berberidis CBS 394.84]